MKNHCTAIIPTQKFDDHFGENMTTVSYFNDSFSIPILRVVRNFSARFTIAIETELVEQNLPARFRVGETGSRQRRHVRDRQLVAAPLRFKALLLDKWTSTELWNSLCSAKALPSSLELSSSDYLGGPKTQTFVVPCLDSAQAWLVYKKVQIKAKTQAG